MAKINKANTYEMDMTSGPLMSKLIRFAIPLALSSIIQLLFNAADIVTIGQFSGNTALAAVGSTGALINLIINLFIGLSVGTNVVVAKYYAARDLKNLDESVHTSVLVSIAGGIFLIFVGFLLSYPMLSLMGCPDNVIDQAVLYMRIYFIGMPFNMLYNFGSAILRSVGDTKRPLYFLIIAGIINVILNLIFVIVFHLDVAGVALATIISQLISSLMVFVCLIKSTGIYQVHLKRLRIVPSKLLEITKIGLPAGLEGAMFSISNILIQSSINSFGSTIMAGSTAAGNIEGFVYVGMNAFYQASLSFTSQNVGARNFKRMKNVLLHCLFLVTIVGLILGFGAWLGGNFLLKIYTTDPAVIECGVLRLGIVCTTYFLCGMMDIFVGSLYGMGYSFVPMLVSVIGVCGFRFLWIFTVFAQNHSFSTLLLSYPTSWILTAVLQFICYLYCSKKLIRKYSTIPNR